MLVLAISAPTAAFLGALVGGVASAGATYWFDGRRARAEGRAAARLLTSELQNSDDGMTAALENDQWTLPATYDSYDAWIDYWGALAGQLDGEEYGTVTRAFRTVSSYQGRLANLSNTCLVPPAGRRATCSLVRCGVSLGVSLDPPRCSSGKRPAA